VQVISLGVGLTALVISLGALTGSHAQPSNPSNSGTRLITTGTGGGPLPRAHRANTSNVLIVRGTPYVIDAGDGTARRLAKAKVSFRDIGVIFITHGHHDHTSGLATLLSVQWNFQRNSSIHIYGPSGTQRLVRGAVEFLTGNSEIRISEATRKTPIATLFIGHDAEPGLVYEDTHI